jgi:hypothetical protein
MSVILVFAAFVLVGDTLAVLISAMVERFDKFLSLLVFLGLFMLVFWIAWSLAVRITERYLLRSE